MRTYVVRDAGLGIQTTYRSEHHGSDYGGWILCPTALDQDSVVYSLGVGDDISFDLSVIERYGATVYAFDATPKSVQWVHAQQLPGQFRFYEYAVLDHDGTATFYPPDNPDWVSYTVCPNQFATANRAVVVATRRLSSLMKQLGHTRIDVLKMDIEGSEYQVIDDMLRCGIEVRQLLVEFHHRFTGIGMARTKRTIKALARHGYKIFAVSGSGDEVSFIRE